MGRTSLGVFCWSPVLSINFFETTLLSLDENLEHYVNKTIVMNLKKTLNLSA